MEAKTLKKSEENQWEEFIKTHPLSTIHQTPQWGHFQEKIPYRGKYWIITLESKGKIIGGTLLVRHSLPKGFSWLYAARGPLLNYDSPHLNQKIHALLEKTKEIAKEQKSIFLRIDPPLSDEHHLNLPNFQKNCHGFQPDHTLILDLTKSEEEILKSMKPKGRYNIKLAEKKGVEIVKTDLTNPKELQKNLHEFYKILKETTKRDGFNPHDENYYLSMLESLGTKSELYLAKLNNEFLAGVIVAYFNDTATYYFGASSNEYRNVMAPYLLHWKIIQDAKSRGYKFYDFFGIAPENAKDHPWRGVTDFKKKFGGQEISYQKPQEYIFKKLHYWAYKIYKKFFS